MKKLLLNRMFITVSVLACLNFFSFTASAFSGSGTGTYNDPYQITTADQLNEVNTDLASSYKLMADIDLTAWIAANAPTTGWIGIGRTLTSYFSGNFNGNGHAVTGLWNSWNNTTTDFYHGLFGTVGGIVEIKNLGVVIAPGKSVSGSRYLAGIVGMFVTGNLTMSSCFVQGDVTSLDTANGKYVGGLVGQSTGSNVTLTNCYAGGGTVTTNVESVGGLIGWTAATGTSPFSITITNCYASNTVVGSTTAAAAGIFEGSNTAAGETISISNCVSLNPSISGKQTTTAVGRIHAYHTAASSTTTTLTGNFAWDGTLVNGATVTTGTETNNNGSNKTIYELTTQATYSAWDFVNVWQMGNGSYPFPVLRNVSKQPGTLPSFLVGLYSGIESNSMFKTKVNYNSQSGNIVIDGKSINETVNIYNYLGRLMLKSQESVLNISNFSKGIYLVNIAGNTSKIIKN